MKPATGLPLLSMNYFEFYELPIRFSIDVNSLRQKYFALSKQYHPDFFVNESDEKKSSVEIFHARTLAGSLNSATDFPAFDQEKSSGALE